MTSILSLSNVDVSYGRTPILREISLEIEEGSVVSLIGRNGVGKTTLIKTIVGLLSPNFGEVNYRGDPITDKPANERARLGIGYVPQGRGVFPRMTVRDNLRMGERVNEVHHNPAYEKVFQYFPILQERTSQKAGTLSGGEQQMLVIGRALIGNPELVLLDEPSEGLQPSIVQEISETVREINDELGTTIFFAEQHLDFTINTSQYCYVMEKGSIVNQLPADEIEESEVVQRYITM